MNTDALKEIDLRRFVTEHYPEIATNGRSSGRCPFHPHDDNPSFSIYPRANGKWAFKCHTCGTGGSIVDLVMRMAGLDFKEARKKACEMAGIPDEDGRRPIREHIYHDENGAIAYKKVKYKPGLFPFYHLAEGKWVKGKGDHPHIPFRLDKIKNEPMVYLVEGERDADTLAAIDFPATSMPCGKGDLDRSGKVLPHLAGKEVRVLYDCGNESDARAIAMKLAAICPKVTLLTLPGRDPAIYHEFDITDLLDELDTDEGKRDALYGILAAAQPFEPDPKPKAGPDPAMDVFEDPEPGQAPPGTEQPAADTPDEKPSPLISFPELRTMDLHVEYDIEALLPKNAVTFFYGKTSVGKTWVGLAMAEAISSGLPIFGKRTAQRPVVYVDAENPLENVKERADILDMSSLNARIWHSSREPGPPKLDGPNWELYDKILPTDCAALFDTRRALTDGKENDDDVAALVMNRCKALRDRNRTIVILSHPTKANDRDLRGSGVWADLADHTLQFYKVKERGSIEEDSGEILPGSLLCLATGKKTRFAQISPVYLTLTDRGIVLAEDPDEDDFQLIADLLAECPDSNQGQIVRRVQEAKGKNDKGRFKIGRNAVLRLIGLGEINKRWSATGKGLAGKTYALAKDKP